MPPDRRQQVARYSPDRDVLFVSVRPVPRALSEPAAADFFWLHDVDTADIVGFECLHFSRNVRRREWLRSLPTFPTYTLEGSQGELPLADLLPRLWWTVSGNREAAVALG